MAHTALAIADGPGLHLLGGSDLALGSGHRGEVDMGTGSCGSGVVGIHLVFLCVIKGLVCSVHSLLPLILAVGTGVQGLQDLLLSIDTVFHLGDGGLSEVGTSALVLA